MCVSVCAMCVRVLLCVHKGLFCAASPDPREWEGEGRCRRSWGLPEGEARSSSEQACREVTRMTAGDWEAPGAEPRAGSRPEVPRGQCQGQGEDCGLAQSKERPVHRSELCKDSGLSVEW